MTKERERETGEVYIDGEMYKCEVVDMHHFSAKTRKSDVRYST